MTFKWGRHSREDQFLSNSHQIFVKYLWKCPCSLKKMRERGQEGNIQKILSTEWFASQIFFPEFSIWCLWFSNLSHLALMNTRHFFSVPYVLWSLRKKMHPNNFFFFYMFWFYPIIIYILHSLMPICNVFTIRKGNKKRRKKKKHIWTFWTTDTGKPGWKKIISVPA